MVVVVVVVAVLGWRVHLYAVATWVGVPVPRSIVVLGSIMMMMSVMLLWPIGGGGVLALLSFVGSMFAMFLVFAVIAKEIAHVSGEVFERIIFQDLLGLATA